MSDDRMYLIWCHERNMYWKPNRMGYTDNIDDAGRYSHPDAFEICYNANCYSQKIEESMIIAPESVDEDWLFMR